METKKDFFDQLRGYFPGIILLFVIGYIGKILEPVLKDWTGVKVEYVLIAIVVGLIIRNTIGVNRIFEKGIDTYELWLKIGIVLLGARFLLQDIFQLGGLSLILVIGELFFAVGLMVLLGRLFRLGGKLTSLLAVGSSICGVSAIIAARGAIEADDKDSTFAIAAILALGAFGLFFYPFLGHLLGLSDHAAGLWIGLSVDNTAEAIAAGRIFSEDAFKIAALAKSTRNAMIGFVVLAFAVYWASKGLAQNVYRKGYFLWQKFPKFVLGFIIFSVLSTIGFFSKGDIVSLKHLYKWFFLLTFAGVGLKTDFREMMKMGLRPFYCGAIAEATITAFNLLLIFAVDIYIGF